MELPPELGEEEGLLETEELGLTELLTLELVEDPPLEGEELTEEDGEIE